MRHILRYAFVTIAALGLCTACAATAVQTPYTNHAEYMAAHGIIPTDAATPLHDRQKDAMECLALASQMAMGAGAWTSVAPVRAAIYDHAKAQYYQACLNNKVAP